MRQWPRFAMVAVIAAVAFDLCGVDPAHAQTTLSAEDARALEFGKEIYKVKANCQFCHKWDASGDTGYGGVALSLRKTSLTPEQFAEVVKCGRPLTGMPYHDKLAYTDKRCFGATREDLGKDLPPMGEFLSAREIDAVVRYLFAKAVGRGESTYEDCVDFWGRDTRQCEPMKK
jgi:mono/diheme cytochrome c family protein